MKKGFTLIELLAVIVILAIIALIATPIVLSIVDETKNNSTLRSSEFYLDAVEYSIAKSKLSDSPSEDGTYDVMPNGNICLGTYEDEECTGDELKVEVKGELPLSGTITIADSRITGHSFTYNGDINVVNGKIANS